MRDEVIVAFIYGIYGVTASVPSNIKRAARIHSLQG
jgi:hypothetical protein